MENHARNYLVLGCLILIVVAFFTFAWRSTDPVINSSPPTTLSPTVTPEPAATTTPTTSAEVTTTTNVLQRPATVEDVINAFVKVGDCGENAGLTGQKLHDCMVPGAPTPPTTAP